MPALRPISGNHFVYQLLHGHRNFSGIALEESFNLDAHPQSQDIKRYCRSSFIGGSSLILDYSTLHGFQASRLWLPWASAIGTDFTGAHIVHSNLKGLCSPGAILNQTVMNNSILTYAKFWITGWGQSIPVDTNHEESPTKIEHSSFQGADLRDARLNYALITDSVFDTAVLDMTLFDYATIRRTSFTDAYGKGATFHYAHLQDITGWDSLQYLSGTMFKETTMSPKDRGELARLRESRHLGDLSDRIRVQE